MNTLHLNLTGGDSFKLCYVSESQPYYICAPDYTVIPSDGNMLHKLCSALNKLGFEALLEAREVAGSLWTPQLTEAAKAAHYSAGKKPIVIAAKDSLGPLKSIGLQVKYLQEPRTIDPDAKPVSSEMVYINTTSHFPTDKNLLLPIVDLGQLDAYEPLPAHERYGVAYYQVGYKAAGGDIRDFGPDATDLGAPSIENESALAAILCKVERLYTYEYSKLIDLARLCGCPVVLLPNAFTLKELPKWLCESAKAGVAWGEAEAELEWANSTVLDWRREYLDSMRDWEKYLQQFVSETQSAATELPMERAWPQSSVDLLDIKNLSERDQGQRADRKKFLRVNEQFERWTRYCTIREIDADIYAEHLSSGKVPSISVVIDQRGSTLDDLADTLDNLAECLWRPSNVLIVSDQAAPDQLEGQSEIQWLRVSETDRSALEGVLKRVAHWVLLIQSGTSLAAQSLVEWGLAVNTFPQAELIYADEDFAQADGTKAYPFFKPNANIEMLRCTNYLGNAVLARSMGWAVAGCPLFDGSLYAYALQLLRVRGRNALAHIDTVLVHSRGHFHTELESLEYAACTRELSKGGLVKSVRPLERLGTWLPEYAVPQGACVSLVMPTGIQTGYMRSLLDSLHRYPQDNLAEIILVCSPAQVSEVEYALANVQVKVPYKIVELEQESYNHGAALNAAIAHAAHPYILVTDDDTEMIQERWLEPLLGIAAQADIGCVAPRLLTNRGVDARVTGGPLVLGINGVSAPYNGDSGLLQECGVQSRLQLTQDVGGVTGHFFLFRKADWTALNGFDVATFGLWFTVLDFCLRLSQRGKRHVWTPLVSVMHQGGKTVGTLTGDFRMRLKMADSELTERNNLLRYWAEQLANDPNYNRHLSLLTPFDIESTIVVDWNPRRHDRPRVLACPLTSGAGQYRVVEPLNALQDGGLAQTCAVIPLQRSQSRILQPLELVRAAPDKLILQHSVDDAQLGMIEKYKLAMPNITIIQMVDDVLGEVPVKHPNWNFQKREGHQRMVQALKKSDRLVVTTETLLQHYKKYVADVRLLPNCLDKQWADLRQVRASPQRLRVGWVGAGQHRGDLELITEVIKQLAPEVDWVFMGMCTDEIKPYLKEFHGFVSIGEYPKKMASLQLDIAIAPLESNFFNECKSNLRLLEYGAMGWPVVCSDVFPYRTMDPPVSRCSDSVEEWVAALRVLINDEALRLRKGAELNSWVQSHFLLKNRLSEWHSAIFNVAIDPRATAQSLQQVLA